MRVFILLLSGSGFLSITCYLTWVATQAGGNSSHALGAFLAAVPAIFFLAIAAAES